MEVTEVIWDTSGHRGQLGVITELNWRPRRQSETRQVTEGNFGAGQVTEVNLGSYRAQLEVTEVIWDTSSHIGQLGVITELN